MGWLGKAARWTRAKWKGLDFAEARRREAGGSGIGLGWHMAWSAVISLAGMSLGEGWRPACLAALALVVVLGWRSKRKDDRRWDSPQKARENRRKAWREARLAEARWEAGLIAEEAPAKDQTRKGPKRL